MTAAHRAIVGASIRTLDPSRPYADAVAMRDGIIVAVGSDAEVRDACDARTELIDGSSMALVPGLVDAHIHPFWVELNSGVDLHGCTTLTDLRKVLAAEHGRAGGGWVLGRGIGYGVFADTKIDGRHLVEAVDGAPALVTFMDGHTAVATPRALELAGVTGQETFPDGSHVVTKDGTPTGELRELSAIALVQDAIPPLTADQRLERQATLQRRFAAVGLTGLHAMDGTPSTFDDLRELEAREELLLRAVVPLWQHPETPFEDMRRMLALRAEHGRLWRSGAAKFFIDGVIDTGTGWLDDPDASGDGTAPFWSDPDRYTRAVALFARAGFQCATHAVGDRAARAALDAYRAAGAVAGVRHRVEHLETLKDPEVARFAPEGVAASMQPLHMQWRSEANDDTWSRRLGAERAGRAWRTGDLERAGAVIPLGSDWPVASFDPRVGMAWTRLRRPPGRRDASAWNPGQELTAEATLRGYTTAAAWAVSEEDVSGRIVEGCRADITGFAADPVQTDADDLPDLPVRLTIVDGRIVYRT